MNESTHKQALNVSELEQVGGGFFGWIRWENIVDTQEVKKDLDTLAEAGRLILSIFGK